MTRQEMLRMLEVKETYFRNAWINGELLLDDISEMIQCALENGDMVEVSALAKIAAEMVLV